MLTNPRPGTPVILWYARKPGSDRIAPHHGKTGVVIAAGQGRPRNHMVLLDSGPVVVPAGNLRKG